MVEVKVRLVDLPCFKAFNFEVLDGNTLRDMEFYMKKVLGCEGDYSFYRWDVVDSFSPKVIVRFSNEEDATYFILANKWLAK